ncbi:MAG: cytochrome ubiquinol oxidase subunit I [Proteobacteria bacterium]|nr:cytochrome ubiquinol oxidase subunit I [Pseudomonadota bacterium]
MDPVLLARIQFALTIGFHFIFPPITIGMAWLIFWFMNRYKKTKDESYGIQARFWLKLFAITFAVGVATGITMEFQFGTNWAEYSRFVGDIFGAPLAAEGLLAFFLESTFMGVLLFGWKRFSTKTLWVASLMVAVGSTLSAFWIIAANSWMQTPAGFHIVNGRAELTSFFEAVFNPSTIPRFIHTVDACLITGAFFMLGLSAWYLIKGQHVEFAKKSLKVSLIAGFVSAAVQLPIGHFHAVQVAETQPEKLAAFEGLFETQKGAPALLFGIPDAEEGTVHAAIEVPKALSIMISGDPDYEVKGLNDFPRDEWPPVGITFFTFHLMFLLGMYFIGLTGLGLLLLWKKKLYDNKLFLKLAFISIPLPIITNELGWIAAEVGRQPWIVYRVPGMRTSDAVSVSVSAGEILASIIMFTIIYSLLFFLWIYLLKRALKKGPEQEVAS